MNDEVQNNMAYFTCMYIRKDNGEILYPYHPSHQNSLVLPANSLVLPSSALVRRIFSILAIMFGDTPFGTLLASNMELF